MWFSIGTSIDLVRMFQRLKQREVNNLADDWRVVDHQNAEDVTSPVETKQP